MSGLRNCLLIFAIAVAACGGDSVSPLTVAPSAPTAVLAAARTGEIVVSWHDASETETSYRVEVSTSGAWTLLAETAANATAVTHSGVEHGVTYHYRVRACNGNGCSGWVETSTAWVGGVPPSIMFFRFGVTNRDNVNVSAMVAHGGAVATIYFQVAPASQDITTGVRTATQEITPRLEDVEGGQLVSTIVYGLTPGTDYVVMVVVKTGIGTASQTATFTTKP